MSYAVQRNTGRPRAGGHSFSQIPSAEIQRSVFDRTFGLTTAFNSGLLIPILVDEVLPGDTYKVNMSSFVRMSVPFFPVFDNITMDYFFFFVPNRLVWDNWVKMMGEQRNPADSTSFLVPEFTAYVPVAEQLEDYMGIPVNNPGMVAIQHNSLPFRAYNLIWNEWFRDQNLQNSVVVDVDDGPDAIADYVLKRRGKRHDYFTSALPFPQKGDPVLLPLGLSAPVDLVSDGTLPLWTKVSGAGTLTAEAGLESAVGASPSDVRLGTATATGIVNLGFGTNVGLTGTADLSLATAATINQIREAFQIQKLLERDARGGTRYIELIKAHFGVTSPDARLQRPEYLGGGSAPVNVHPVQNTNFGTVSSGSTYAKLGAFATHNAKGGFVKSFTEHGYVIGLVCVRADLRYQQGLERFWSRSDRYDFYWPALSHLGEQEVLSKELYMDGGVNDDTVFGYQERYAEYRYKPSLITGKMRSTHATPLDQWHLAQEFSARPLLNDTFISENAPFTRILAITTEPQFFGDFYFKMHCARPMPTYSVPGLVDHF